MGRAGMSLVAIGCYPLMIIPMTASFNGKPFAKMAATVTFFLRLFL